jgi:hypothetical protein
MQSAQNCHLGQPRTYLPKGRLRSVMPQAARFIDALREAFGAAAVDSIIAAGMRGEPGFYAIENGRKVGTPYPTGVSFWHDGNRVVRLEP